GRINERRNVGRAHAFVRTRERLQVLHDIAHALGARARLAQCRTQLRQTLGKFAEHVRDVVQDVHQRIIDLVRDTRREYTHACQSVGLRELNLHLFALGDLPRHGEDVVLPDVATPRQRQLDGKLRAVFAYVVTLRGSIRLGIPQLDT